MSELYKILSSKPHNEHYLKRYCKFIDSCREKNKVLSKNVYIEKHHICPKAADMFPEYKNSQWNIVNLTVKQHIIAHHLLYKTYNNKSQTYAFWQRVNIDGHTLTTKSASILLEKYKNSIRGNNNHFYGKKHINPLKCGLQNLGKTPWNKGLSKASDTRIASGERNYFSGKKFVKEQNPMFEKTTVYDSELNLFRSISIEEFKSLKNVRYFNPNSTYVREKLGKPKFLGSSGDKNSMFGKTRVYDIESKSFITIPKEEYQLLKNVRYYHSNSKYVKENVK